MDSPLKQRLIGAAVLAALAVVFLPMLLDGPDVKDPDAAEVPLTMPASPDDKFETRELTLAAPEGEAPPGGVLGMDTAPPAAPTTRAVPTPTPVLPTPAPAAPDSTPAPTPAPAVVAPPAPVVAMPAPVAPKPVAPAAVAGGNYALNVGTFTNVD